MTKLISKIFEIIFFIPNLIFSTIKNIFNGIFFVIRKFFTGLGYSLGLILLTGLYSIGTMPLWMVFIGIANWLLSVSIGMPIEKDFIIWGGVIMGGIYALKLSFEEMNKPKEEKQDTYQESYSLHDLLNQNKDGMCDWCKRPIDGIGVNSTWHTKTYCSERCKKEDELMSN